MTASFVEIASSQSPLWDFGWLATTRFRIEYNGYSTAAEVIHRFITSPLYQRSFCESPDPWGASIERHGPFPTSKIVTDWYRKIMPSELRQQVRQTITDAEFDPPANEIQMRAIEAWINRVESGGETIFLLDAPQDDSVRVEWGYIWFVFTEFISVDSDLQQLTVAVIGYD